MKPALSLVFFTVLSGAGLGLAVFWALFPLAGVAAHITGAVASGALVAGGLGASVLHLANVKNAWRAVMRVRTSWLSREAVLAAVFFPLLALTALLPHLALQVVLAVCAMLTVACTAMIYQSLKTIPQWNHAFTLHNYFAFAMMSGGVVHALLGGNSGITVLAALILAVVGKAGHYLIIGKCEDIQVSSATNFSRAQARLLDAGHTGETFLTQEFIYHCPAATLRHRRALAMALTFLPVLPVALPQVALPPALIAVCTLLMFAGLLLERWLFFAEARHSIRAYHGA